VPIGISTGRLGKIYHPPRFHTEIPANPVIDDEIKKAGVTDENLDDLFAALSKRQVVLVEGGTGSGKSTYIPCRLIEPGTDARRALWTPRGPVVITQPRIQATISIPRRVAQLLGCGVGPRLDVGYRYGGADQSDLARNRIVFMTDGVLLNWLLDGAKLERIAAIVIDEAHERNLNIDIILALLRRTLPTFPHLKVIISSATIDTASFREFFGDPEATTDDGSQTILDAQVPVIRCASTAAGYDLQYRDNARRLKAYDQALDAQGKFPQWESRRITFALVEQIVALLAETPDSREHILGFLATAAAVKDACRQVQERIDGDPRMAHVEVLPLYRQLSEVERLKATEVKTDPKKRRVIIATNIAETSLTIEELGYVVDSGLIIQTRWDDDKESTDYPAILHSQSGCRQRWGRVGRVRPGVVRTLYTSDQFQRFIPHTVPEVQRANMDSLILKVKTAGFEPTELKWLSEPMKEAVNAALQRLKRDGALADDGHPTALGLEMQRLGLSLDDARLMIEADRFACSIEMATLLAMQEREFMLDCSNLDSLTRLRATRAHKALRQGLKDDIEWILKIYGGWKGEYAPVGVHDEVEWSARWFIDRNVMQEAEQARGDLLKSFSRHGKDRERRAIDYSILERVRVLLAMHLPRKRYHLSGDAYFSQEGVRAVLDPNSLAHGAQHLIALQVKEKSGVPVIKRAAVVEPLDAYQPAGLIDDALVMRDRLRSPDGSLTHDQAEIWRRILIDQLAPLGARFSCESAPDGDVMLGSIVDYPSPGDGYRTECESPAGVPGQLGDVGPPVRDGVFHASDEGSPPEVDQVGAWDGYEEGSPVAESDAARAPKARLLKRITPVPARLPQPGPVEQGIVEVVGYDRSDERRPRAIVRPSSADPFGTLSSSCSAGSRVNLEAIQVESSDPETDSTFVLVTREVSSGLEVLLDPEDVTLDGFGWVMSSIPPGAQFEATVTAIDPTQRQIRVTLLPQVISHLENLFRSGTRDVKATIGQVHTQGQHIDAFLEGISEPENGILHTARIDAGRLLYRISEYSAGQAINVALSRDNGAIEFPRDVPLDTRALHKALHYDAQTGRLIFRGQMSFGDYVSILGRTSSRTLSGRLHRLFRDSNRLRAHEIDRAGDRRFLESYPAGSDVQVTIDSVEPAGLVCTLPDGRRRRVARADIDWNPNPRVADAGAVGDSITARVVTDGDGFRLSLKELRPDPLHEISALAGQDRWVKAAVTRINEGKGLYLKLPGGVNAFIPWHEAPGGNHDARARFRPGTELPVRILSVNPDSRQIMLTARPDRTHTPPLAHRERGPQPDKPQPRRSPPAVIAPVQRVAPPDLAIAAVAQVTLETPAGRTLGSMVAVERLRGILDSERDEVQRVLGGEWLEFVEWSDDPLQLVRNAMLVRTARGMRDIVRKVDWIKLEDGVMAAKVYVDPSAMAFAIGPRGMHVRLVARLVGLAFIKVAAHE